MNRGQEVDLLNLLKTLAQDQRLAILRLMAEKEQTVSGLAEILDLTEPTISHHVKKLHSAGLLHLRMEGNHRYYRLNMKRLNTFKQYISEVEQPIEAYEDEISDDRWIDELDWDADDKKVLRDNTVNGRLRRLPTKERRWQLIMRWLATKFELGRTYTEKEVNAILTEVHSDYATLRRSLIEYGYMRRERGGSTYWLAPEENV